jgi:CBS domain-containing protein
MSPDVGSCVCRWAALRTALTDRSSIGASRHCRPGAGPRIRGWMHYTFLIAFTGLSTGTTINFIILRSQTRTLSILEPECPLVKRIVNSAVLKRKLNNRRSPMDVKHLMRHQVAHCKPDDSLNIAAQMMWEESCGSIPVVDGNFRPVGFLTDRDICMAAYTQGRSLREISVDTAMSTRPVCCGEGDELVHASQLMRDHCLRRLPVVDGRGILVGLLSLDDIACESQRNLRGATDHNLAGLVGEVYGRICSTRCRRRHSQDPPLHSSSHSA